MRTPPLILAIDDDDDNREIVRRRLEGQGYRVVTGRDGIEGLELARAERPDIVILDVMMPRMDGFEALAHLRADATLPFMPVIMLTAKGDLKDVVAGLDRGADDYLVKPIEQAALLARVRAMLRLKAMHEQVQAQSACIARHATQLASLNADLEERVKAQVAEIAHMQQLRRFLAPQLARSISGGGLASLEGQRREIVSLFCDLRNFTAFAETSEPEDVMAVLKEYHRTLGPLIHEHEGTIERFTGDGMLIFFNAPLPCSDPALRAVRLGIAMRKAVAELIQVWTRRGHHVGFGIGIAQGYATCGLIGFDERLDYSAIGTVTNTAARLCGHAAHGQVLVTQRIATEVEQVATLVSVGEVNFRGLARPIAVFNVA